MRGIRRSALLVAVVMVLCVIPPSVASAARLRGANMRGGSPRGNAPKSGYTKVRLHLKKDTTFYLSNRSSRCYLLLAYPPEYVRSTHRVTRNAFFKAVRTSKVGANVDVTWKWKRIGGKRRRYVSRILATNLMNDQ